MPIFRSDLQARLLLRVLTSERSATAADLARVLRAPEATVSREVRRLLDAGILRGERVGRAVLITPASDNAAIAPLRQLLIVTYGPSRLIEMALAGAPGIDAAFIHGSWAARYLGEPGGPPGDVDVVVVGSPDRREVDDVLNGLESNIARDINITFVSQARWVDPADPFVATVRARPLVELDLGLAAL
ncbi:helix-turn-helix domain-containing protein [Cellulomonas sp. zg-B12]|nr:helix-turn-helix domain-containing protein [Cellulomonas xiejunii]